jgi:hypothetical protein
MKEPKKASEWGKLIKGKNKLTIPLSGLRFLRRLKKGNSEAITELFSFFLAMCFEVGDA